MTLVLLAVVDRFIVYDMIYIGAVAGTVLISTIETLANLLKWSTITNTIEQTIPLASIGLSWMLPAVIGAVTFGLVGKYMNIGKTIDDHDNNVVQQQ